MVTGSNWMPPPMSAAPEPPSSVENANWFVAVDCVVSKALANAVIGTLTLKKLTLNVIPELLFALWQLFALVGNVLVTAESDDADVVRPVR